MADRSRRTVRQARAPYTGARVEELEEPLLPRWFVLLAIGAVPVAFAVFVMAFVVFGPDEVPVAERRPPPLGNLTTDVGQYNVGESSPQPLDLTCSLTQGIQGAGSETDRERIALAAESLCTMTLPEDAAQALVRFGQAGGEVRFAQFQATGVDSTMETATDTPRLLLNARFAREGTDPLWIAPLLAHDTLLWQQDASLAESALRAREVEARVCDALFADDRPSRACDDAAALLDLVDPVRALQAAGFR
ncbi:hypothetical protein BH23ACT9_BH23ACT9_21320 [soil metagenome]